MRLVYQYFGAGIALGMYGTFEEIQTLGNYLFNHGGAEGQIHFVSDSFGYILTDKETLLRGVANGAVVADRMIEAHKPRSERLAPNTALWPRCLGQGQVFLDQLEREDFLEQETPGSVFEDPSRRIDKEIHV